MLRLEPREVVLNLLATTAAVRDPLRRVRDRRQGPDYAKVVEVALASLQTRREFFGDDRLRGANILEIGSGTNACLALLFVAAGARRVVNVEIDRFGFVFDERLYRLLVERAAAGGLPMSWPPEGLSPAPDGKSIRLDPARISLHLGRSAVSIPEPDASTDIAISLAVMEHVLRRDMRPVVRELHRLTRPGGTSYHRIDIVDHYTRHTQPFRFLRYSEIEYRCMYGNRGSASNRYRIDDFERIFREEGFSGVRIEDVHEYEDVAQFERWQREFHAEFQGRPRDMMRAKDCLLIATR